MRSTENPLYQFMQEKPVDLRFKGCILPPEGHPCYGCGNADAPCLLPCYRVLKIPEFLANRGEQIQTIQRW